MPPLPDRSGGRCRTRPTSSSSAAATPGSTRPASSPRRGARSPSLEAHTLGLGRLDAQRRHRPPRLQVGPAPSSSSATARRPAGRCTARRSTRYDARQAADRRRGDRLRVPRVRLPRARLGAVARRRPPAAARRPAAVGVDGAVVPRERLARRDRLGRLPRRAGGPAAAGCSTRASTSPAWSRPPSGPARTSTRASARGRSGARRTAGSSSRPSAARSSRGTSFVATNGYTDGVAPTLRRRVIPIGSYIIATEPLPEELARSSRRRAGRSSTRRTSSTTGTSRPTAGWSSAAGPASCRRTSTGPRRSSTGACSRSTRSSPATGSSTRGAATSASRSTGCRTSGGRGRRDVRDGLLRDRRGADDRTSARRSGSGWPAAPAPALARLQFPLVPAPYEGRPWFLPFAGEWFRLKDRARPGRAREDRLPDLATEHRLGQPRGGLGGGRPARCLRLGLAQRPPDRAGA